MTWSTATFDEVLDQKVRAAVNAFWLRYGGAGHDREELLSEAYYHAARAVLEHDPEKGALPPRVTYVVEKGLLDSYRGRANRLAKRPRAGMPALPGKHSWEDWCRKLAAELGGDAAAVISAALHAPGEVAAVLAGSGWSGPRVLAAMDELRRELG